MLWTKSVLDREHYSTVVLYIMCILYIYVYIDEFNGFLQYTCKETGNLSWVYPTLTRLHVTLERIIN